MDQMCIPSTKVHSAKTMKKQAFVLMAWSASSLMGSKNWNVIMAIIPFTKQNNAIPSCRRKSVSMVTGGTSHINAKSKNPFKTKKKK